MEPMLTMAPLPCRAIPGAIMPVNRNGAKTFRVDADRSAAALLAGIQGGVGIILATGDQSYLEAALDEGIGVLRGS